MYEFLLYKLIEWGEEGQAVHGLGAHFKVVLNPAYASPKDEPQKTTVGGDITVNLSGDQAEVLRVLKVGVKYSSLPEPAA